MGATDIEHKPDLHERLLSNDPAVLVELRKMAAALAWGVTKEDVEDAAQVAAAAVLECEGGQKNAWYKGLARWRLLDYFRRERETWRAHYISGGDADAKALARIHAAGASPEGRVFGRSTRQADPVVISMCRMDFVGGLTIRERFILYLTARGYTEEKIGKLPGTSELRELVDRLEPDERRVLGEHSADDFGRMIKVGQQRVSQILKEISEKSAAAD